MERDRTVFASRCVNVVAGAGVGQVVGGHVHCLHRRDGTRGRGRDALLQVAHLGGQRGLVTNSGRHTAEQCGHLGTGLREAEDVVHEQQNVLALITEVFGLGQTSQADAQTGSRRLVHLAVDQAGLVDNAGVAHLQVQVGTLTGTLANAGEHGSAAVLLSQVVDEFLDDNGLANAGAAEQTGLAALDERLDQVDGLDARLKDLGLRDQLVILGSRTMDGHVAGDLGHGLARQRARP